MMKVFRYSYKFYSMDAILMITTSLSLVNTFGTDIGKYDDCFGLSAEYKLRRETVEHQYGR